MQRCLSGTAFSRAVLIATTPPTHNDPRIEWRPIPPMDYNEYSAFVLTQLYKHVETSHALIVQHDGFILNPQLWDEAWLELDYIGAPWRPLMRLGPFRLELRNRVGNGGFSLRSRRILEMTSPIDLSTLRFPTVSEDIITCYLLFDYLTERGVRFADLEVARQFSVEEQLWPDHTIDRTFGFHGRHLLPRVHQSMPAP